MRPPGRQGAAWRDMRNASCYIHPMADDAVLEILKAIQADLARVKADGDTMRTDIANLRAILAEHIRLLNAVLQDTREIRAGINNIAKDTPGEVRTS